MKLFYNIPEVGNHWFAIYYTHHKKKFEIIESIYNHCLFFKSEPFKIVVMQTVDTLILADNNFASTEKETIKSVIIIIKNKKYLTFIHPLKFNSE